MKKFNLDRVKDLKNIYFFKLKKEIKQQMVSKKTSVNYSTTNFMITQWEMLEIDFN